MECNLSKEKRDTRSTVGSVTDGVDRDTLSRGGSMPLPLSCCERTMALLGEKFYEADMKRVPFTELLKDK